MSGLFPDSPFAYSSQPDISQIEMMRQELAASGPIANAVLYNNAGALIEALSSAENTGGGSSFDFVQPLMLMGG